MFREMRRKKQLLPEDACVAILQNGISGVLAVLGDDGYPYAVPLSYVYHSGKLYFHCAKAGHKLDAIQQNPKASFCVVAQDEIVPEKFTTYFQRVIAFGKVRILENTEEKQAAISLLAEKYAPGVAGKQEEILKGWNALCMLEMQIEHLTGKQAIELTKKK